MTDPEFLALKQAIRTYMREYPEHCSRRMARNLGCVDENGYETEMFYVALISALDDIVSDRLYRHIVN